MVEQVLQRLVLVHAELVTLGIRHHDPWLVRDNRPDDRCAEADQSAHLGIPVSHPQIKMQAVLHDLRFRHALESQRPSIARNVALRSEDRPPVVPRLTELSIVERLRPETCHAVEVGDVQYERDPHAGHIECRACGLEGDRCERTFDWLARDAMKGVDVPSSAEAFRPRAPSLFTNMRLSTHP